VLITYRSDELHRSHPFLPTLQSWRRSGVAEVVKDAGGGRGAGSDLRLRGAARGLRAGENVVHSTLEAAMAQQLIEERPDSPGSDRWRPALTEEMIYTETVTPRHRCSTRSWT
jgi:hypothetical protein